MTTTITLNTKNIGQEFVESIQKLFPKKNVAITITEDDTNDWLNNNPTYKLDLLERIKDYEENKKVILIKETEIL